MSFTLVDCSDDSFQHLGTLFVDFRLQKVANTIIVFAKQGASYVGAEPFDREYLHFSYTIFTASSLFSYANKSQDDSHCQQCRLAEGWTTQINKRTVTKIMTVAQKSLCVCSTFVHGWSANVES